MDLEWVWDSERSSTAVSLFDGNREARFHANYSVGTACARGTQLLSDGQQHYWEIKILRPCFGTDIMIGVGTEQFNVQDYEFEFTSMLGVNAESWGLSYKGYAQHNGQWLYVGRTFQDGSVIGVHLDMWRGEISFYIDGCPVGVVFSGLRGKKLYPMVSSTAARSFFRLQQARSFSSSLQFLCCKALRRAVPSYRPALKTLDDDMLPPNLRRMLERTFSWLLDCNMSKTVIIPQRPLPALRRERIVAQMVSYFSTNSLRCFERRSYSMDARNNYSENYSIIARPGPARITPSTEPRSSGRRSAVTGSSSSDSDSNSSDGEPEPPPRPPPAILTNYVATAESSQPERSMALEDFEWPRLQRITQDRISRNRNSGSYQRQLSSEETDTMSSYGEIPSSPCSNANLPADDLQGCSSSSETCSAVSGYAAGKRKNEASSDVRQSFSVKIRRRVDSPDLKPGDTECPRNANNAER